MTLPISLEKITEGEFVTYQGERFYKIYNVDKLDPFFMTLTSSSDHWLFASSNGAITAGRVSSDTAIFPYQTVDKLQDSTLNTGCKTIFTLYRDEKSYVWEPFNSEHNRIFNISRNLLKSSINDKICFEEINHDYDLSYRYTWSTSEKHGFVRQCEIENSGDTAINLEWVDGFLNILPAGVPASLQDRSSNLVDAYKWTELDAESRLALYTLYSGISDRAEPSESLKANIVYCLNTEDMDVLLSREKSYGNQGNSTPVQPQRTRGVRGAYFTGNAICLDKRSSKSRTFVLDVNKTQGEVIELRHKILKSSDLAERVFKSIEDAKDKSLRIMASCDAIQRTAEEIVSVHHYANVLFNVLRGGYFSSQYTIETTDYIRSITHFNRGVFSRNQSKLANLAPGISYQELLDLANKTEDAQLIRLTNEYLPITFGRRHGDPSRPWNKFTINVKDRHGELILSYEGNWRDIFQNWEALLYSYPEFIESVIAKFVNASTMDGYNPYRITKQGIDWEIEEPDEPWSNIGYWGDHQIIYLLKILELSRKFHPGRLEQLLHRSIYSYANVPYKINSFEYLVTDPKNTVRFDSELANRISSTVDDLGADGKLVLGDNGEVLLVNLLEKLLVPLLAKLNNFVVDGGIWLNTQRPEWNDANNALVGQGLSVVTLCYLYRYMKFLQDLLEQESGNLSLSLDVIEWIDQTSSIFSKIKNDPSESTNYTSYQHFKELGISSSRYRKNIYGNNTLSGLGEVSYLKIKTLLHDSIHVIEQSIKRNRRDDGLYHTYNLLEVSKDSLKVSNLYLMLEGQVAALSSGTLSPGEALELLRSLYVSDLYREDIDTFMLYPDRDLPGFLGKNIIQQADIETIPLLQRHIQNQIESIIYVDPEGNIRFNSDLTTLNELSGKLESLDDETDRLDDKEKERVLILYKKVFDHQAYTGRSGTMFGYEGLGCVYWHMIGKLLLAVQETYYSAEEIEADDAVLSELAGFYYKIRKGLGFNKTPSEYGAFPMDPYSHTPKQRGAQQPGMTGHVKEEILARFGELGIVVKSGEITFQPKLLRFREFSERTSTLKYCDIDGNWNELMLPDNSLAFTWCQLPIVYTVEKHTNSSINIEWRNGAKEPQQGLTLDRDLSNKIFKRTGEIRNLHITLNADSLLQ